MTNYTPGEGYEKGFKCRMSGGPMPTQALGESLDPYWQEYATGWRDADTQIINEAREKKFEYQNAVKILFKIKII